MFNILLLCTANICRSPVSQLFLERMLKSECFQVDSAGIFAVNGNHADPVMQRLMSERGYTAISEHRSKLLLPHHIQKYQLILCMENFHIQHVQRNNVHATGKCLLLGHWNQRQEVSDPVGQSQDVYEAALSELYLFCKQWSTKISDMGLAA